MPPNDGFACGLHLIMSSEVFLIPKVDANFKNKLFIIHGDGFCLSVVKIQILRKRNR